MFKKSQIGGSTQAGSSQVSVEAIPQTNSKFVNNYEIIDDLSESSKSIGKGGMSPSFFQSSSMNSTPLDTDLEKHGFSFGDFVSTATTKIAFE